jgi:hypothetical protein
MARSFRPSGVIWRNESTGQPSRRTKCFGGKREIDRIAEEVEELIEGVEAYLTESGFRRLRRSSLLSLLQAAPGVGGSAAALQGAAGKLERAGHVETKPLAYLAFARTELRLDREDAGRMMPQPLLLETFSTAPVG